MARSTQDHRTAQVATHLAQTMTPAVKQIGADLAKRNETVVHEYTSSLQHYEVVDMIYEGRPARVLFSGHREVAQSGLAQDNGADLLFDYNQRFFEVVANLQPQRILLIGGGVYTLPQALLVAFPRLRIDVVELDPDLDTLATRYFGFEQSDRLHIIHADGQDFLKREKAQYDLILLDVFEHDSIPISFLTQKFIRLLHKRLLSEGAVAINLISAYYGRGARLVQEQYQMYSRVFPTVDIFPATRSLVSYWLSQNFILIAQKTELPISLQLRYPALEPPGASED